MKKIQDSEDVIPLEDLLIESYNNKDDINHIESLMRYVDKHRYNYTIVSKKTLYFVLRGYYNEIKTSTD